MSPTVDCWSTKNQISLLTMSVEKIDNEWTLQEGLLALEKLTGGNSSEYLAKVLWAVLKSFSLKNKVGLLNYFM